VRHLLAARHKARNRMAASEFTMALAAMPSAALVSYSAMIRPDFHRRNP